MSLGHPRPGHRRSGIAAPLAAPEAGRDVGLDRGAELGEQAHHREGPERSCPPGRRETATMLLHLIADYGLGDLAFAEVRQRLEMLLPDAAVVVTSVDRKSVV